MPDIVVLVAFDVHHDALGVSYKGLAASAFDCQWLQACATHPFANQCEECSKGDYTRIVSFFLARDII